MRAHRAQQQRAKQHRAFVISALAVAVLVVATIGALLMASPPPSVGSLSGSPAQTPEPSSTSTFTQDATASLAAAEPTAAIEQSSARTQGPTESTIGTSVQGRSIDAVVFGSGSRKYLLVGGVHGDEWGASAAEEFVERLTADPASIPDGVEIHVVPCLNPDGRELDTRGNANKVDLNRNMPSKNWASQLDPNDSSATRGLNGGTSAGSEPESKVFIKYMDHGFLNVVSLHSQGGLVDYDGDGGEVIARKIAAEAGYPVKHLGYQAYIKGSMGLCVPEVWHVPIITVEMSSPGLNDGLYQGILAAFE